MSATQDPRPGCGFIYILSNPSMRDVYKIGLTTNSVYQRMVELNTTGVPKRYSAEKIFEVEESFLSKVERSAHMHLKSKGMHHGKEFFEGKLHDCILAVEDAIFEVTNCRSEDIIGKAVRRAEEKKIALEAEQRRLKEVQRGVELKRTRINEANSKIDEQREIYKAELKRKRKSVGYSETVLYLCILVMLFIALIGPIGWFIDAVMAFFVYTHFSKGRRESENKDNLDAEAKYPYVTF